MQIAVPNKLRIVLYVLVGLGTPVVQYLVTKGILDLDANSLWSALVSFVASVAAFKAFDYKQGENVVVAAASGEPTNDTLPKPDGESA